MKTVFKYCLAILTGIILCRSAEAGPRSHLRPDSTASISDTTGNQVQLALLPIVFSSPDTRWAFGVLPQGVFRIGDSSNPSSLRLDAYYTQNHQYHVVFRPSLWLQSDSWNLSGKISLKKWPTSFYGIGNDSPEENREKFTERLIETSVEAHRKIGPGYFAGLSYTLRHGRIATEDPRGILDSGTVPGNGRSIVSLAGIGIMRDTRDNHFYPAKGSFHRLSVDAAQKAIGSDFEFIRLSVDMRRYITIFPNHVLALQGVLSVMHGEVPFRMLSSAGSTLRGYSTVRFIDRNMVGAQLEYRVVPVAWRVGITLFTGAGDVFHSLSDIQRDRIKYSAGIGIRYLFSRREKITIRYDYGIGRDTSGDYLDLNEAF